MCLQSKSPPAASLSLLKRANIRYSEKDPKQRKSQPDPQRTRRALEPPATFLLELPEVHYSGCGLRQAAPLFAQVEAVPTPARCERRSRERAEPVCQVAGAAVAVTCRDKRVEVAVNAPSCSAAVWRCGFTREELEFSACDAEV